MSSSSNKSRLTTTHFFLIFCLIVAFVSPRWGSLDFFDNQLFQLGTLLLPAPEASPDIYTVIIPTNYVAHPDQIKKLRLSLNRLKKYKASSVALITPSLPRIDYQRIEKDKDTKTTSSEEDLWQPALGELTKLAWTIEKNKVLIGIASDKQNTIGLTKPEDQSYLDHLISIVLGQPPLLAETSSTRDANFLSAPFNETSNNHHSNLLWTDNSKDKAPSLALQIFKNKQNIDTHDWKNDKGITIGSQLIRTDYSSNIFNFFSASDSVIKSLTLSDIQSLRKDKIKNKTFIFGDNESTLLSIASPLNSLSTESYFYTPAPASWGIKAGFVLIFIYLVFFSARLQKQIDYLLILLLLFCLIVLQFGLLLTQSIWLPLAGLYLFLLAGRISIGMKRSIDSKMDNLKLHTQDALWQLAQHQYDQESYDKALTNLLKCSPTSDVLDLMYNIGQSYERRRQYDKALYLYSDLNSRKPNYKDVKKRLNSLSSISSDKTEVATQFQSSKTLVMPDLGLQLPVLGRYEIERELGRGAMGVVYLGNDPKINRQVAIKTLDYSQFSENEVKAFKLRFFREAEAAGRLSHTEIVTVYDVGEEDDFAFIAMDYVSGVPLSDFAKPENLLPIKEIYEIIASVADALDYAHQQKIIHRDIKPGNIMYNPKSKKIKITDFGIARITDNAHTRTGSFLGSPSYMSPEQMLGAKVERHADIYALGVTFYQLLTGALPFKSDSIGNLAYVIANDKHRSVRSLRSELPSSATRITNKALQKKPKDRYTSGKEMADAIRRGIPKK